jgi:hypothetical protein
MTKKKVIRENVFDLGGRFVGWFDRAKAEKFEEATRWDGNNHISIATGSQYDHEILYRTAGGRWVLHSWSQWEGRPERYQFTNADEAREWLLLNEEDEAVEKYFGEIEDEVGPGRPEIGPPILVHLPAEMTARLDALAEQDGVPRAEVIRRLLGEALEG